MTFLILAAALTAAPKAPAEWKFVNESTLGGRSVLAYRAIEFADTPALPPHADDTPPAGSKFGSIAIGPGSRHLLGVVWHAKADSLWIDTDGDGRYAMAERYTLADTPVEVKVVLTFGDAVKHPRTVLVRKRGPGVVWAVRGYTAGELTIGGKVTAAALTDGNADGCFDGVGVDRLWLDLDGDGKFDPLTEQFPLGAAVSVGKTVNLIGSSANGLEVRVRERPSDTGTIAVRVAGLPGGEVVELSANYVGEFGELIVVKAADKPVTLPVGKYRADSIQLSLSDTEGQVWRYRFYSTGRSYDITIEKGKDTVHRPLDGLKMAISLDKADDVRPGEPVLVRADLTSGGGLSLTECRVGGKFEDYGRGVCSKFTLTEPGSVVLDERQSGFQCGHMCQQLVRVPAVITVKELEIQAVFPSGPLAGDIVATKKLTTKPAK